MASILICSVPAHGHITPMLAAAERFVERGDDVRLVTGSRHADKVAATGATYVPWLAEADFEFEEFAERFPERAKLKGPKAATFDFENLLARPRCGRWCSSSNAAPKERGSASAASAGCAPSAAASVSYCALAAPPNLHYIGPLSSTASAVPLPDWWSDLDGSRPVIHVTQGTVANTDYDQVIAPALRALADDDVLVVVATGGRPLDTLPPLPANARVATFLPYDELLPRTAVYVTNGGYGGVQYALRYGVPIVTTGGKEDKPEVGARVAWSGVGRRFRTERPSPRALRRAILAVLADLRYRNASRRLAADMATAPGFAGLADIVERLIASSNCDPFPVDAEKV
jgi:UDP:flavonoid glycosyltransferase YjiC (YdhE family)